MLVDSHPEQHQLSLNHGGLIATTSDQSYSNNQISNDLVSLFQFILSPNMMQAISLTNNQSDEQHIQQSTEFDEIEEQLVEHVKQKSLDDLSDDLD
ncbi:unnamed protein product [Rotaria magnacalcarata]|uniref:Uncharacterized protein n=1 Tax=Rotaria magnacalcarata TaxID=392030 RepID=A0A816T1R9_9BILA|nr:unnamed protein product [Rotaria magnacalcarata]CAF2087211.1 unnamed protein product [Rotaria magnacalcarata]CAF2240055.1 unnamed protein product [Rotaria magnacalcarata]CAF4046980.1 unnamed protein product [Rotaria magnacalcarata]CAF4213132.1 unnamed protein product [Rotaria magnacalcarata]